MENNIVICSFCKETTEMAMAIFKHDNHYLCSKCNKNLEKNLIFECIDCGQYFLENDLRISYSGGDFYCSNCYAKRYVPCCLCGQELNSPDAWCSEDSNTPYCERCYNETFCPCDECENEIFRDNSCCDEDGRNLCESCYNNNETSSEKIKFKYKIKVKDIEKIKKRCLCFDRLEKKDGIFKVDYKEGDYFLEEIAKKIGDINYSLYLFGLHDEHSYDVKMDSAEMVFDDFIVCKNRSLRIGLSKYLRINRSSQIIQKIKELYCVKAEEIKCVV